MANPLKSFLHAVLIPYYLDKRIKVNTKYPYMLNINMLWEDIHHSIMPIGGNTKIKSFEVILKPDIKETGEVIAQGLSKHSYSPDLKEAVCEFINDCGAQFLTQDSALYSLKYASNESGITEFDLVHIDPKVVFKIFNNYFRATIQYLESGINVTGFSKLAEDSIIVFKPTKPFHASLRKTRRNLVALDSRRIPDWSMPKPALGLEILKAQSLAVLEATRNLGWNARRTANEEITEYYYFDRFLTFEGFKIEIRNSILGTLNEVLRTISPPGTIAAEIIIKGLPDLQVVEEARDKLREGPTTFEEIIAPFLHH